MKTSAPSVRVIKVSRHYQRGIENVAALSDVTLDLWPGEFVGLSGPSGSGKTTLLNIIGLADRPASGDVFFNQERINFANEGQLVRLRRQSLGYVFQHFNLLPTLSALDNVASSLVLGGLCLGKAREISRVELGRVGLADRERHLPCQLSGGEMQRVAIARACVSQPTVILADEPTGNLDSVSGMVVLNLLHEQAIAGATVFMATHSEHARKFCSRLVTLRDGKLVNETHP